MFVDEVHFKNGVEVLPQRKISIYEVTNVRTIIRQFSISNEMTTPNSYHGVTTPMKT